MGLAMVIGLFSKTPGLERAAARMAREPETLSFEAWVARILGFVQQDCVPEEKRMVLRADSQVKTAPAHLRGRGRPRFLLQRSGGLQHVLRVPGLRQAPQALSYGAGVQ